MQSEAAGQNPAFTVGRGRTAPDPNLNLAPQGASSKPDQPASNLCLSDNCRSLARDPGPAITPAAGRVFELLAWKADARGWVTFNSHSRLRKAANCSRSTYFQALSDLKEAGLVAAGGLRWDRQGRRQTGLRVIHPAIATAAGGAL